MFSFFMLLLILAVPELILAIRVQEKLLKHIAVWNHKNHQ